MRIGAAFAGDAHRTCDLRRRPRAPTCATSSAGRARGTAPARVGHGCRACASTGGRSCCGRAPRVVDVGERWTLDGATAYVERNWGDGFPPVWWWGEAHDFGGDPVTVAFAGGPALGPLHATAVVVHVGGRLVRLGEPVLAGVREDIGPGRWVLRGRSLRHRVEIEAGGRPRRRAHARRAGAGRAPHAPVVAPAPRRPPARPSSRAAAASSTRARARSPGSNKGGHRDRLDQAPARAPRHHARQRPRRAGGRGDRDARGEDRGRTSCYRHYIVAGQRPTSGEQNDDPRARPHAEAARAPRARADFLLDAKPGPVELRGARAGEADPPLRRRATSTRRARGRSRSALETPRARRHPCQAPGMERRHRRADRPRAGRGRRRRRRHDRGDRRRRRAGARDDHPEGAGRDLRARRRRGGVPPARSGRGDRAARPGGRVARGRARRCCASRARRGRC